MIIMFVWNKYAVCCSTTVLLLHFFLISLWQSHQSTEGSHFSRACRRPTKEVFLETDTRSIMGDWIPWVRERPVQTPYKDLHTHCSSVIVEHVIQALLVRWANPSVYHSPRFDCTSSSSLDCTQITFAFYHAQNCYRRHGYRPQVQHLLTTKNLAVKMNQIYALATSLTLCQLDCRAKV